MESTQMRSLLKPLKLQQKSQTVYNCPYVDPKTGEKCTTSSIRKWNVQRHINDLHKIIESAPIQTGGFFAYVPNDTENSFVPISTSGEGSFHATCTDKAPQATSQHLLTSINPEDHHQLRSAIDVRLRDESVVDGQKRADIPTPPPRDRRSDPPNKIGTPLVGSPQSIRKRTWDDFNKVNTSDANEEGPRQNIWLGSSFHKKSVPLYDVKRSKKYHCHPQQRAILWMTSEGKEKFDEHLSSLLSQWGVTTFHKGTCVLMPSDWEALSPLKIMELFCKENCPLGDSDRMSYEYSDHLTSFSRAAAWFDTERWERSPPRGIDLDNFLDCGGWKSFHGSHLCHHENCIVHLVYEPAETNYSRKDCHQRAIFLRGEGKEVLRECEIHTPGCLMQHAALTTYESYLIQFSILRQAQGLPLAPPPARPRRHPFKTFEYQLPLQFCDNSLVTVNPAHLTRTAPPTKHTPDLICAFCPRIRSFKTITGLWSHVIHKHADIPTEARLENIRQSGILWREYWFIHAHGGKNDALRSKLEEITTESFNWDSVLAWNIR